LQSKHIFLKNNKIYKYININLKNYNKMKENSINNAYEAAKERYAALGVDTENAMAKLQKISLSLHCWQTDDVTGFENHEGGLTGGIQVTGNYPGRARNIDEVRADIVKAKSLLPGSHRLSLHEIYGDFQGEVVDRDQVEPKHFQSWMEWAKENNLKLDFNTTSFSHPKSGNLTLANPDKEIRDFWIEHTKRCRAVSEAMGKYQGDPCIMNLWIHDGSKEVPVNRLKYRQILEQSLDEIFATKYDNMKDCIEAKLFGIGLESYTVGSYDFYLGYGAKKGKIVTLDTGHFHLTESIADKMSSLLLFTPEIMLHVSRPIRWDSDHVVIINDDLLDLTREIVRCNQLDKVHIGLDYFDATINRIGAYAIGVRSTQKALLQAFLEPQEKLQQYEANDQLFQRLAVQEELKAMPWNAVWDKFCEQNDVPVGDAYIAEIEKYEEAVTSKR
jgi:L-rhamnose isomerase